MSNVTEVGSPLASLRGVPATVVGGYLGWARVKPP